MSAIVAVRLREYDRKKRFTMRSYTSASGKRYKAGDSRSPSAWRVGIGGYEIQELSQFEQFEIKEFASIDELKRMITFEMEERARIGLPAITAKIDGAKTTAFDEAGQPKREFGRVIRRPSDVTSAEDDENTELPSPNLKPRGRKPAAVQLTPEPEDASPEQPVSDSDSEDGVQKEEKKVAAKKGRKKATGRNTR